MMVKWLDDQIEALMASSEHDGGGRAFESAVLPMQGTHVATHCPSTSAAAAVATPKSRKRTRSSNTRLGFCEHPQHYDYRQSSGGDWPSTGASGSSMATSATPIKAHLPRRGRPPKGMRAANRQLGLHDVIMTTRPLPRRLAAVVGLPNLYVCLTCLKRSDQARLTTKERH
ncbi:hypothetical protein BC940DRAFT_315041 [Gongronella butleri]|nr:hypothetical protein BC940DRAFT_315041 [Gongronella butleri]